jgi:4-amino-4-deoxy-L-arabinose transferase-like glycosyltransferase
VSSRTQKQPRKGPRPAPSASPARAAGPAAPWTAGLRPLHVALALAGVHLALVLLSIVPEPHDGGDNAAYLALARSILDQGAYREIWEPAMRPQTQYPPGFPLLLAGAMSLGITPWIGFKVISALFSGAAVALSYLWARRVTSAGAALGMGVIITFSRGMVDLGRWELSDVPFWAFTMLALWAFARLAPADAPAPADEPAPIAAEGAAERRAWWKALGTPLAIASVATLLAYATRSAGLPLVVAAIGWLAWRRRWTALGVFAAVMAPYALGWWLRNRAIGGAGYTGYLWYVDPYRPMLGTVTPSGMVERVMSNVGKYTSDILPYLLTGVREGKPALALGIAVVLLALAGWAMRMRRPGVSELWLPMYVGLVLLWPSEWAGNRFLLPAIPVMLVCAAEPLRALIPAARLRMVGIAAVAVVVVAGLPPLKYQLTSAAQCRGAQGSGLAFPCLPEAWADVLSLAEGVQGQLPDNSAILARKATLVWAYSGYRSRTYPFTADPDTLLAAARDAGARYLMLDYMDNLSVMYVAPVLMQRPQAFCVMRTVGQGRATLMAILPGAERMPNLRDRPGNESADVRFPRCPDAYWAPGKAPPPSAPAAAPR